MLNGLDEGLVGDLAAVAREDTYADDAAFVLDLLAV